MITDLANLGPALRAQDVVAKPQSERGKNKQDGSFDQVMKDTSERATPDRAREPGKAQANNERRTEREEKTVKQERAEAKPQKQKAEGETTQKPNKNQAKQQAMLEFMDSMESELGIPPQRLVEAMAQLSPEEQKAAPEITAEKVVQDLNLDPEDQEKALAMYTSFLSKLQKIENIQPRAIEPLVVATAGLGGLQAVQAGQQKKVALNQSLEKLNNKFFMQDLKSNGMSSLATSQNVNPLLSERQSLMSPLSKDMATIPQGMELVEPQPIDLQPPSIPVIAAPPEASEGLPALDPKDEAAMAELAAKLAAVGMTAKSLKEALKADPENAKALKMEAYLEQQKSLNTPLGPLTEPNMPKDLGSQLGSQLESGQQQLDSGPQKDLGQVDLKSLQAFDGMKSQFGDALKATATGMGMAAGVQSNVKTENAQQVIQQAQYLVNQGGGEANIQMTPEGMGQVHLKVTVKDGKVNVQMSAENNETKKALENSLQELRHQLGSQKLAVDSIKVDVGNNLSGDPRNQDQSSNMQGGMNRDQTRQFFGQFRDDNFGGRNAFFETPGTKFYNSSRGVDPLQPQTEVQSKSRYQGSGKGTGLDMVA